MPFYHQPLAACLTIFVIVICRIRSKLHDVYLFLWFHRFSVYMSFYGLVLHIQHIGSNVFLSQVLFGLVNIPSSYTAVLALNHIGRRTCQMIFVSFLGISILITTFLPKGEKRAQVEERKELRDSGTVLTQGKGGYVSSDPLKPI